MVAQRPISKDEMRFLWDDGAASDVRTYFESYSGRRFERLAGSGDRPDVCNRFTADDLVALSMLSINVPGEAAIAILETQADELNGYLARIPTDLDLWNATDAEIGVESAAERLWLAIQGVRDCNWVTAGKLLARKRSRLIPVYDTVVRDVLGRKDGAGFWHPLRDLLVDGDPESARHRLEAIRSDAGVEDVSILRVFDVVAWMHGKRLAEASDVPA